MTVRNREALLAHPMSPPVRRRRIRALDAVDRALDAIDPRRCTARALDALDVDLSAATVLAFGKAARGMAEAVLERQPDLRGIAICTSDDPLGELTVFRGEHPLPATNAQHHGQAVLALADSLGATDTVLCLVSGGGSAMLEAPAEGASIEQIRELTGFLLASGADIFALNKARAGLSALKAGKLARRLAPARIINLVLSDVPGGGLEVVASGPTVLTDGAAGTEGIENIVVADNATARAATGLAEWPQVLSGAAHVTGARFHQAAWMRRDDVVAGGETTVDVHGPGVGGRNHELILGAMTVFRGGLTLAFGTDGVDGTAPSAGALVDPIVMRRAAELGLNPDAALAENDSYPMLAELGAVIDTGPTGTNVADLAVHLI